MQPRIKYLKYIAWLFFIINFKLSLSEIGYQQKNLYTHFLAIKLCFFKGFTDQGIYGKNSSKVCSENCMVGYCDTANGTCLSCLDGYSGPRCDGGNCLYYI